MASHHLGDLHGYQGARGQQQRVHPGSRSKPEPAQVQFSYLPSGRQPGERAQRHPCVNSDPSRGLKIKMEDVWFSSVQLSVLVLNRLQQEEAIESIVNKQSSLIMYSNSVSLLCVFSDDGIALNGIQLCSILIRFRFCVLLISPLFLRWFVSPISFHLHVHSDVLNGFRSLGALLNRLKSVFRSSICCDRSKRWSLNLKKKRKKKKSDEKQSALWAFFFSYLALSAAVESRLCKTNWRS